jgi:uncharacterized membrane protein HdeD (DUF308 family)
MATQTAPDPLAGARSSGWILIAAGAISIVAGLLAIVYPDITLLALAIFAGINLMVLGVLGLIDAFDSDADGGIRALSGVLGVLGMIAGLVVLRRPGESLLAILLVLGIWLVVSGAVSFFRSFDDLGGRALRMLVALSEIVLGILILALPDLTLKTVAILAGIGFLLRGLLAVYAGWQLRALPRRA